MAPDPTTGSPVEPLDVMLPYWGDPALLFATVRSVLAQEDPHWRLTVVDDCYPDPSVAAFFDGLTDPRVRYERNEQNLGITANYEKCRDLATGAHLMFLGCDDLMHPGFVGTVRAALLAHSEADVVQVGVRVIDEHGHEVNPLGDRVKRLLMPRVQGPTLLAGEELATSLLRGNWLYWPSLVFRTDTLRRYRFREGLPIIQDLALLVDMVVGGESLLLVPDVQFSYRRHSSSASSATLLRGDRFADEARYYGIAARLLEERGWRRAARTARIRWSSRLHALSLLPTAVRSRAGLPRLLVHAVRR